MKVRLEIIAMIAGTQDLIVPQQNNAAFRRIWPIYARGIGVSERFDSLRSRFLAA
jgi:hypothetical protein